MRINRAWSCVLCGLAGVVVGFSFAMQGTTHENVVERERIEAKNMVDALTYAAKKYVEHYNRNPLVTESKMDFEMESRSVENFLDSLVGKRTDLNPDGIAFFVMDRGMVHQWLDPWGAKLRITVDGNQDSVCAIPGFGSVTGFPVVVWSQGIKSIPGGAPTNK
jgi:hypothetical protein